MDDAPQRMRDHLGSFVNLESMRAALESARDALTYNIKEVDRAKSGVESDEYALDRIRQTCVVALRATEG